ncbi:hypothetical protein EV652_109160 [Kribbella steppae]|uniref:DOD-type homing endonuclease domain-containing protein n=1 Tax=Kribbella steppae TaxID=2512223 RepID=A0A4R2HAP3_9ACTN|nr:helix-turn-helix domain-containing protein [Kribbella steppae]TCO23334.1 hypothetical protein EV652_109160 [Kribbella steppae]
MYDGETRATALAAIVSGESLNSVSKRLGVSRTTLRDWRDNPAPLDDPTACPRCTNGKLDRGPYAHLLGLYLGDGCVSSQAKGVHSLRLTCDAVYPRLIEEAAAAMAAVYPARPVHRVDAPGCVVLTSYWKHWPCLLPQHGPGRKHLRPIELADWQQDIVAEFPEQFLRGLFDADGCRVANWTVRMVGGKTKRYDYPRYMFSNESADIMRLCQWALDLLDVPWRMPRSNALSVAHRNAVAKLDEFIGPKS